MMKRRLILISAVAVSAFASGGGKPGTPPAIPGTPELRVSNEFAPPGGTAQIKLGFTNPTPIMTGSTGFSCFDLFGVSLWSPLGDAAGVAVQANGAVSINLLSPLADLGTNADYPFLTVTMHVPPDAKVGSSLAINPLSLFSAPAGTVSVTPKPGVLAVGGGFSIHGVNPGGGTYPAGTTIRIEGSGFTPQAQLRTPQMKFSSYQVVSPTEIDFTLKEQTTLDSQAVQVTIGGVTQTYYSYLRGVPLQNASRAFLNSVDPIFQLQTHALASYAFSSTSSRPAYTALALQNPNPGPAAVTINLTDTYGTITSSLIVLPSGYRVVDDIYALLQAAKMDGGGTIALVSTAPIQILGLRVDESSGVVTPFLPAF